MDRAQASEGLRPAPVCLPWRLPVLHCQVFAARAWMSHPYRKCSEHEEVHRFETPPRKHTRQNYQKAFLKFPAFLKHKA